MPGLPFLGGAFPGQPGSRDFWVRPFPLTSRPARVLCIATSPHPSPHYIATFHRTSDLSSLLNISTLDHAHLQSSVSGRARTPRHPSTEPASPAGRLSSDRGPL